MKKDKEWLIKRVENYIPLNDKTVGHVVDNILDIIRQLDEPDEREQLEIAYEDILSRRNFWFDNKGYVAVEKPTVPKFLAEWYEEISSYHLQALLDELNKWKDKEETEIKEWFYSCKGRHECGSANAYEIVARMKLFGYEVEKEKLYVVELTDNHLTYWLAYDLVNKVFFMSQNQKEKLNKFKKRFTEQEIKDHDERFWQFRVEVNE